MSIINSVKTNSVGLIVWALGSLFFLCEYFVRVSTGVLSFNLMSELNIDAASIGLLSAYFYYSYITMQIPVGILIDRFGIKILLSGATIIFGLACLLFASMHSIETGYLARFIMGIVGAFAFVSTLKLIAIYFPLNYFARLAGITQAGGMLGAVIGTAPMAYLFTIITWRYAFILFAIIFIIFGILMWLLITDQQLINHNNQDQTIKQNNNDYSNIISKLKIILQSKQIWFNCCFIGLMYAPTEIFGEEWGVLFCSINNVNLSFAKSSLVVSFIFIGMTIGCPIIGYVCDYFNSRIKVMRYCSIIAFMLMTILIYGKSITTHNISFTMQCILMFIYGIAASGIIPSYAIASKIHHHKLAGISLGVTNMASVIIGAIFIPIVGLILDYHTKSNTLITSHHSQYNISDFNTAFILLPICFLICFVLTYFIDEITL